MSASDTFILFSLALCFAGSCSFWFAQKKSAALEALGQRLHSRPSFHGWLSCIYTVFPAFLVGIMASVLHMAALYDVSNLVLFLLALIASILGFVINLAHIKRSFRARQAVETFMRGSLMTAASLSVLITLGIILSVVFESIRFFNVISFWDFITGTIWQPDAAFLIGAGRDIEENAAIPLFGSIPIFAGTLMITTIAMLVAVPIGLFSAIYMSEYASEPVRKRLKPLLEILAGIPTVVYGFFAAITVSPIVVSIAESVGLEADFTNALTPGLIMGVMIIPFMSSLSDDIIRAVPQSLRDGSLALGTTQSETIRHIVLPAALPGLISAFLIAISRAIGETMIVVMAAGLRPNLTMNPLEGMTTVTVKIVEALTGDQAFDSAFTLAAFALGLVLLMFTLLMNITSSIIVRRFSQRYE